MGKLEDLKPGATVKGISSNSLISVVSVRWFGTEAIELTYKDSTGAVANRLVYRSDEPTFSIAETGHPWSFDADPALFKLASEARRIQLAHLFDPHLAVHTSLVEPLPHQITAVYESMLPRQPLRFLLADDPGSGKTIMAGLLIKELIARGDVQRCMIVCPGNLVDQWQDEMDQKFNIPFEILTSDKLEASRTGNWFSENPLAICRLDQLSRREDLQNKLRATDWDLVICDEAHKMSATFFGNEIHYTKRHKLGQLLSGLTRHFLLLTATPHNGKETDFQLFMALLDGDRFEGRFRDGVHTADVSDLMRRLVKEELVKFDGKPLFPERYAHTVNYTLSDPEAALYEAVTSYVREEFNRADKLDDKRKSNVGFALTILQRRLASSPEAIYQSLKRRRERLERRIEEEQLMQRGAQVRSDKLFSWDENDLEELPDEELEKLEDEIVDLASAARTIEELKEEVKILKRLETAAKEVRDSGTDHKWEDLSQVLRDNPEMFDRNGARRKLIIFSEHRDTVLYLQNRIRSLLGHPEAVITIQGGMGREQRKIAEMAFTQNPDVTVLVATDAAGEGINLQRAHLMVNYDLPWNPNRIEQRFGRIHRIGQTEVCHLWNLVARETREGKVYHRLLEKLNAEREALGGRVFDILGRVTFDEQPLRKLLIKAIRDGNRPEVRARLDQVIDSALDHEKLASLIEERALAHDSTACQGGNGTSRCSAPPAPLYREFLPRRIPASWWNDQKQGDRTT
jgi:SNF2 family DNA or RNA helicase